MYRRSGRYTSHLHSTKLQPHTPLLVTLFSKTLVGVCWNVTEKVAWISEHYLWATNMWLATLIEGYARKALGEVCPFNGYPNA
jgi:hypothetical protein